MARPTRSTGQTQRTASNPYSRFKLCCANLRTKEHAQLVGIISLSVFVCLIVVSYSLFGVFAIAYISSGIVIYGFLMESLLRKPNKISLLGYVTFEALQIAFYLSLAIYILIPLIYSTDAEWSCENPTSTPSVGRSNPSTENGDPQDNEDCTSKEALIECLAFLVFLIVMKTYFTRVMLYFYKYCLWLEQHRNDLSASYVNNRGVQINVDDNNIFPPPPLWHPSTISPLPTYDEATSVQKPPVADEPPRTQDQQNATPNNNLST